MKIYVVFAQILPIFPTIGNNLPKWIDHLITITSAAYARVGAQNGEWLDD